MIAAHTFNGADLLILAATILVARLYIRVIGWKQNDKDEQ